MLPIQTVLHYHQLKPHFLAKSMLTRLKKTPLIGPFLLTFKRTAAHLILQGSDIINLDRIRYQLPSPQHIFWVHPDAIQRHTNWWPPKTPKPPLLDRNFHMRKQRGRVIPGDWDLAPHRFEDLNVYQAIQDRIQHKTPWEKSLFSQECLNLIKNGRVLWGCKNTDDLQKRFQQLDELIHNINTQGYLPGFISRFQGEDPKRVSKHPKLSEEITVNVGRDGDLLFQDGRHRLAVAKALKVPAIAIKILVRHPLWCQKRLNKEPQNHHFQHPDRPANLSDQPQTTPPSTLWKG